METFTTYAHYYVNGVSYAFEVAHGNDDEHCADMGFRAAKAIVFPAMTTTIVKGKHHLRCDVFGDLSDLKKMAKTLKGNAYDV